jgi:RNA polymerase sigma factor (sigma-70 family)
MYQDKTDEELVFLYRQGDTNAFDVLLKRYEVPFRSLCRYLGWTHDDLFVDEILQIIAIAIYGGIKEPGGSFIIGPKGSFRVWAMGIARHKCFHANEKFSKQPKSISKEFIEAFPDDIAGQRPKVDVDPEDLNRLNQALESLPALDQKLFTLRKQGKSYNQIRREEPDFQGFTAGHLRVKYLEIIRKLRDMLSSRR